MNPHQALEKWKKHPFYTTQVVLGLDIGIEGIGVYVRKGPKTIFARTYLVTLPESAPMAGRRQKRAMRRSRTSARHRDYLYRLWCKNFNIPIVEGDAQARTDAWKTRCRAVTTGVASPEAVSVALRHALARRGFSYHRDGDAQFPWGDELEFPPISKWLQNAIFDENYGKELKWKLEELDWWSDKKKSDSITQSIDACVATYNKGPLLAHIEAHIKAPIHQRPKAWGRDFPRDLIEQHTSDIILKHAKFFGGHENAEKARDAYFKILNYARNKPGALAKRKVKRCPYLAKLDEKVSGKVLCALNSSLDVRKLNLVEFLAQRRFTEKGGNKLKANADVFEKLQKHLIEDAKAIASAKTATRVPRPGLGIKDIKKIFIEAQKVKLEKDDDGLNKYYFEQLKDIITPRMSTLSGRANLSEKAAQILLQRALTESWDEVNLKDSWGDFFLWRRDVDRGKGLYPQVEFLMGRRSKKEVQAVPGKIRQIFQKLEPILGQDKPDIVIAESVKNVPRNADDRKARDKENREQRDYRKFLFEKYQLEDGGTNQDRRRVMLYEQQKGLCPYTGKELGPPLNPQLQVDHVFPRERGGVSEMYNLVLTFSDVNRLKAKRTPYEARADFPDYTKFAQLCKWGSQKLDLFLRKEAEIPDWRNLTRTSQIARELREEIARWLGIKGDADKIRERIGAPSGLQTAICRRSKAWREKLPEVDGKKDRENMRHHLWDAAVLAHIPPAEGTQPTRFGGIFYQEIEDKPGDLGWQAIDVGPDLISFEKETAHQCLIEKPRQRRSKQSRTEETIYGMNEEGRLIVRKSLINGEGLIDKNASKWIKDSGIPSEQLPKNRLDKFLEQDKEAKALELSNGTKVNKVRIIAPKESPVAMLPHRNRKGDVIGWKIMGSPYSRMEIWRGPDLDKKGQPVFKRRFVANPRGLAAVQRLAKEGKGPWWNQKTSKDKPSLRREVIGDPLPKYSKKICSVELGDLLLVPYNGLGESIKPLWNQEKMFFDKPKAEHWVWLRVSSLSSSGQVATVIAEKPIVESIMPIYPANPSIIGAYRQFAETADN
jgi:5-methylcytosine-specific restriction endonuclease McrA